MRSLGPIFHGIGLILVAATPAAAADRALIFGSTSEHHADLGFMTSAFGAADGLKKQGWAVELYFGNEDLRLLPSGNPVCRASPHDPKCCDPQGPPGDLRSCRSVHGLTTQSAADILAEDWGYRPGEIGLASSTTFIRALEKARDELNKDDQLLIEVDSHGARGFFNLGNDILPYGSPTVLKLLQGLRDKGVHLGFLLDTCYSGGGVSTWSRFGCAVSIASADHYGLPGNSIVWTDLLRGTRDRIGETDATHAPSRPYEAYNKEEMALTRRDGTRAVSLENAFLMELFEDANLSHFTEPQMSGLNPDGMGEINLPAATPTEDQLELSRGLWKEILAIYRQVGSSFGSLGAGTSEPTASFLAPPGLEVRKDGLAIRLEVPEEFREGVGKAETDFQAYLDALAVSRKLDQEYRRIQDSRSLSSEQRAKGWADLEPARKDASTRLEAARFAADRISQRTHGFLGERQAFERARRLLALRLELRRYRVSRPIPNSRPDLQQLDACENFTLLR